ncbi:MAG: Methionyl-tRNA synthetase (EC [uncultured Aureispira sp.]|uniref:Methionine--tRNA ligase n=1 Tax=uncultured Aureispira sp. TaxID=1331704 RepID=A0A6S6RY55_9BACT|nr:MAG: Methionyl-tRNA synthetase (EC [uncultured Aureispira sp.]
MNTKKHTITAALPYANGALHLGHLAGAYLPADIYARFLRLQGKDVVFVCGSDEHGAAITIRAKQEGRTPQDIIDTYHNLNKETFERLGISFDQYDRTSNPLHHKTAQDFFKKLVEKGDEFEVKESEQYYDEAFDQFLADRYIIGTCPKCGHKEAYGDQCESCGTTLSPTELIEPRSTMSGKKPVLRKTKHWYFRLDKHGEWLKGWVNNGTVDGKKLHDPATWKAHVIGQCNSWLEKKVNKETGEESGGLLPRAITRDLTWGIPVPVEGGEGKVLYVWFDAPIGYISATKQWALENNKDWESYWKGDDVELVHFIGKDNIVFHCIVFPAMLHAHGDYALPKAVPANQFLNLEGRKFSKSKGWVIEQHEYLKDFEAFPNKEDALRYALIRTLPENKDGDFKWDEFVALHDNELVANLGNLVNRVINLTQNYYQGEVPAADASIRIKDVEEGTTTTLGEATKVLLTKVELLEACILKYEFKNGIQALMDISAYANVLLQRNEPWKVWKGAPDSDLVKGIMNLSVQIATILSVASQPFLPFTSAKLRNLLALEPLQAGDFEVLKEVLRDGGDLISAGHKINPPELLFAKINDRKDKSRLALIDLQKEKLEVLKKKMAAAKAQEEKEPEAIKKACTFDDFTKIDFRVGTITAAEKIKKAKKLLKLTIDLGFETRTVVSGIALHYEPEAIIGQQVTLVANLAPREMMGIESQGMVLMAENKEGKLIFVGPQELAINGGAIR